MPFEVGKNVAKLIAVIGGARSLGAAALAMVAGCLYTDPINVPPNARVDLVDRSVAYYRGDLMRFTAEDSYDEDGDAPLFQFTARACFDDRGAGEPVCGELSSGRIIDRVFFEIVVPDQVPGAEPGTYVNQVIAQVEARDDQGATSISEPLPWSVSNARPLVRLQANSSSVGTGSSFPAGVPVDISAVIEDDEEDPVELDWAVTRVPAESTAYEFEELVGELVTSPTYRLLPDASGTWEVSVSATDILGGVGEETIVLSIGGDMPPCIGATNRNSTFLQLIDASGAAVEFAVLEVLDEYNPYPANELGVASFAWSLREGGVGPFAAVGGDVSSFAIDPSLYELGAELELRVEVSDGTHEADCPVSDATCSIDGNTCVQRKTWSIEIR